MHRSHGDAAHLADLLGAPLGLGTASGSGSPSACPRPAHARGLGRLLALFAALWFLFANNPALIAAHVLGDLNADYYFYADSRLQAVVATMPVLAAIIAAAWISLRPQACLRARDAE